MGGWTLADPIACPGVFDLLAIVASRTWRDVPMGSMLAGANAVVLVLALGLLARAVYKITASAAVTTAITLAASASLVLASELAPSAAAAFVVTIAAWRAVLRARLDRQRTSTPVAALFLLAVLAATVTPMMLPVAIAAACLRWRQWGLRVVAVIVVLGTSHLTQMALPQSHACVMPDGGWASVAPAGTLIAGAAREAGPLAIALAVLGLFAIKRLPRDVALSLPILVLVSFWGAVVMPSRPAWTLAPFAIAFWVAAAAGLAEVWETARPTNGGKAGCAALAIVLVALQVASLHARHAGAIAPDGHDRLTFSMMSALVSSLPPGAGLVAEDATISLLARALPSRMRPPDRFHFVEPDLSVIAGQLGQRRVFALPRSQRALQHVGLELLEADGGRVSGLAEVRSAHACTATIGSSATLLPQISGRQQFSLVAGDERSRGPVVILIPAGAPLSVMPVGWPSESMRGIHAHTFDLASATDHAAFTTDLQTYGFSSWSKPPTARYVTRIETWRTPRAPLVLPIALGAPAGVATARLLGTEPDQHLWLCPSIPYEVRPLARRP